MSRAHEKSFQHPRVISFLERVGKRMETLKLPSPSTLVVAASGGMDSMVLLDVVARLAASRNWQVVVAHFNHELRGSQSNADERLVRSRSKSLGLSFCSGRASVAAFARRKKLSIEMAARELRHRFLASVAGRRKAAAILTGHHAGDQAELFFIRLFRGAGPDGLAGMRISSFSPIDPSARLIRPLLGFSRKEISEYAALRKVPFREDASNASHEILRNRIRMKLLPELRKHYATSVDSTISRAMDALGTESDYLDGIASAWCSEPSQPFANLHPAVQRRCIIQLLLEQGIQPGFDLVEHLRLNPSEPIGVPGKQHSCVLLTKEGTLELIKEQSTSPELREDLVVPANSKGDCLFLGMHLDWRVVPAPRLPLKPSKACEYFDLASLGDSIRFRTWLSGDRFQPIGMKHAVKLQDLFTNAKIPRHKRRSLVVGEDGRGRLFWVEGLRISGLHKITESSKRALRMRFSHRGAS